MDGPLKDSVDREVTNGTLRRVSLELDALLAPLADVIEPVPVEITGSWATRRGLSYASPSQAGSGDGPYVENVYATWSGAFVCDVPLVGIAFAATADEIVWIKSPPATASLRYDLRLAARVGDDRATFAASLGGSYVPGYPIAIGADPIEAVTLGASRALTARPHVLASAGGVEFVVVLFSAADVRVGRNRIWRVRDALAASLPEQVRAVVTRKRGARWARTAAA